MVRRPCPNHLLDSACRRSAPSIKQRSNLILSGNGSTARPYSSQLASQMHLHSPSAITMTAVSGIGLSLISSPATFHVSPRKPQYSEWKVCAGVPPTPLIARWSKSPWSAGQPAHASNSREGSYSLQSPPVIGHRQDGAGAGATCVDAARPKRLYRFPGSNLRSSPR